MVSDGTPGGGRSLRSVLGELGTAALALLHTRLELASVELDEVRDRLILRIVLVLVAFVAFAFALLAVSALVVVVFWDTHRIGALVGVVIVYAIIGFAALKRLSVQHQTDAPPFAATLAELERDRVWFADKLKGGK